MDRTERFYKIEAILRQRRVASFAELRAALEVSPATLKRDLAYLRTRFNAPIEWSRASGGYTLTDASQPPGDRHELPGLWFSPSEIHALLTMHQLLARLDRGGLLTPHIAPLRDRLNAMLGGSGKAGTEANAAADQVRRRVRIIGLAQRFVQPRHFQTVGTALLQRKRLKLDYKARGTGEAIGGIARHRCRAWIETSTPARFAARTSRIARLDVGCGNEADHKSMEC